MTLTLGLLSTAKINAAILKAARGTDKVRVVAVASRDGARAQAYASEHGLERAHASYDALLADDAVDAVYISLPNGMHHEWSVRALAAGKHVLCEKPYTRDPAEVGRGLGRGGGRGARPDGGVHVPPPSPDPQGLRARRVRRDRGAPRRQDDLQLPSRRPLRRARPARAGRRRPDGRRLVLRQRRTAARRRAGPRAGGAGARRDRDRPPALRADAARRRRRLADRGVLRRAAPAAARGDGHGGDARARGSVARGLGRRDPRRARRGGRADPDPAGRLVPAGAGEPRRRGRGPGRAAARAGRTRSGRRGRSTRSTAPRSPARRSSSRARALSARAAWPSSSTGSPWETSTCSIGRSSRAERSARYCARFVPSGNQLAGQIRRPPSSDPRITSPATRVEWRAIQSSTSPLRRASIATTSPGSGSPGENGRLGGASRCSAVASVAQISASYRSASSAALRPCQCTVSRIATGLPDRSTSASRCSRKRSRSSPSGTSGSISTIASSASKKVQPTSCSQLSSFSVQSGWSAVQRHSPGAISSTFTAVQPIACARCAPS